MEILITILVVLFIYVLISYNNLVKMKKRIAQAYSTIDVYLTQRFDLIPNLVECVKAYTKYENELFTKIIEMRIAYMNNKSLERGKKLDLECNQLIAYIEQYPELKASSNYLQLQKQMSKIESQLQAARRLYNGEVTKYNTKILSVPSNIIANIFKFKEVELFEIENIQKRENINIDI